ncbi:MAG: alpha/beta fold hydrolase [Candidatus Rokubacteria bacterium]|nr:alpha/beta fold hydrolase [Candidatus Rokubacteria bacterium]
MRFHDRTDAGRRLADALAPFVTPPAVVAGIPRGGVAVALPVVERFGLPLTVVYARKLTAPIAPELAFGALDEDGEVILEPRIVATLGLQRDDIDRARTRVAAEIRRRMQLYQVPPLATYLPGASVLLVDDGLATGNTMRAAVAYARRHGAREIVVAVPCASVEAAERFRHEADRFVGLVIDPGFYAVGAYYEDFSPVEDAAVCRMLEQAQRIIAGSDPPASGLAVSFKNSRGLRLAGELLVPDGPGRHPVVVFAHGWGSSKASPRNRMVATALVAAGIAAFLFDFTGHGDSEGTDEDSTAAQQHDDLRSAADILETLDEVDSRRLGIAGASSGAAAALLFAAEDQRVKALVMRSGNARGAELAAERVRAPTLLIVGALDAPILAVNEELLARLAGTKRMEIVPGGNHLFEDPAALRRAATLTVEWFARHLR